MSRKRTPSRAKAAPISWAPEPKTVRTRPARSTLLCRRCLVGDCDLCVRVGCVHPCTEMRKFGVSVLGDGVEHGAPRPGGARP